jgi:hypothetical protein
MYVGFVKPNDNYKRALTSDVWKFDIITRAWIAGSSIQDDTSPESTALSPVRISPAFDSFNNGTLIVQAGFFEPETYNCASDVFMFNPRTWRWTLHTYYFEICRNIAYCPTHTAQSLWILCDSAILLYGGMDSSQNGYSSLWSFDIFKKVWNLVRGSCLGVSSKLLLPQITNIELNALKGSVTRGFDA